MGYFLVNNFLVFYKQWNIVSNVSRTLCRIRKYIIINDDFNKALHELEAVITANRLVLSQQAKRHQALIQDLITPQPKQE